MKKQAIVCGAGGFIGHHLVKRLKSEGYTVIGADLKFPEFEKTAADMFSIGDLRKPETLESLITTFEGTFEIYQLAADMGGAGYIFTGNNDAAVMHNSAQINLNVAETARKYKKRIEKVFYSSSACIYPAYNQTDPNNPKCSEDSAYPAAPDSEYGWEKLFSERLYASYARNHGIKIAIARFHNIYGPMGTYQGGKEKAPAAICRKVIEAVLEGKDSISIWGDGEQTRSFLYIDACIEGIRRLIQSDVEQPVNIGSDEMVTINQLTRLAIGYSGKTIKVRHIPGPTGVRGRNSDNQLIYSMLGWQPQYALSEGLLKTYQWIEKMAKGDLLIKNN